MMASGYTGDFVGDYIGRPNNRDDAMSIDSPPVKPSFFGVTGHNEIFEETKNYLSKLEAFSINPEDTSISGTQASSAIKFKDLPPNIQQTCLAVLGCIFGPCYDRLVAHKTKYENRLWSNLTVPAIIRSLESTFGSHLNLEKVDLEVIAERICNNTIRSFRDTENSQEWAGQLCGQNLRWESITMLWSVLRRIPNSFEPIERQKFHILENGTLNKATLAFLRHGISLARYFTIANVMILDLLQQKTIVESMIIGDASKSYMSCLFIFTNNPKRFGRLELPWRSRGNDDILGRSRTKEHHTLHAVTVFRAQETSFWAHLQSR